MPILTTAKPGLGYGDYKRGHITVLDRTGLEARVCECYAVVKKEFVRLLPETIVPESLASAGISDAALDVNRSAVDSWPNSLPKGTIPSGSSHKKGSPKSRKSRASKTQIPALFLPPTALPTTKQRQAQSATLERRRER